ncbi:MAG: sn-glycerol-3-phosphate ABC transporter ATP-binding protein UgpC [Candidatus Portiera sp.]|nr:sn-glycerol-3-phosphate ABC transporter ATP-binding protein UgpC [Portiera sp.]
MSKLELKNICKSFGNTDIIKDVSFPINDGEFIVFVGPSGCGKSTLLRLISGLEDVTSGEIIMEDRVVNDVPPVKRDVAMVFQSYALYPHMNTYENMAFGLRNLKVSEEEIKQRVTEAAEILQIQHLLESKPKDMSGGQRQRVAIGRTIVREPKMFLFDEPLSNLDAALRVQMRIEMTRLHKQLKTTMIYVTHDQVEAMTLADRIVVLNAGKVEQIGPPLELYDNPCNSFVAGFIGSPSMNFIGGKVLDASAKKITMQIQGTNTTIEIKLHKECTGKVNPGDVIKLGVRPENVTLKQEHKDSIKIDGKLIAFEELGNTSYGYVSVTSDCVVTCSVHNNGAGFNKSTENASLYFQANSCYIFNQQGVNILCKK